MSIFFVILLFVMVSTSLLFGRQMATGLEKMAQWVSSFVRQDFSSCVDLDLMVDENTLMRRDGSLVSVFEFRGIMQVPGEEEYQAITQSIAEFISNQMKESGHDIQVVYRQESGEDAFEIKKAMARARLTAKRIGLSIDDVLDGDEETLSRVVVNESVWIVVTTSIAVAAKQNQKALQEDREKKSTLARKLNLPNLGFAQNPLRIVESILPEHDGFCNKAFAVFSKNGITLAARLTAHEIIAAIRREIQPHSTSENYRPCLPGDRPPASVNGFGERPWEDIYYPPIWSQLCNTTIEETMKNGFERIFVDGLWHGTVSVDLPPQSFSKFDVIMRALRHIPFRISYRLTPEGLAKYKFNDTMVQFLSFNPKSNNRAIKEAIDAIKKREKGDNETLSDPALGVSIVVTTWHKDQDILIRNMQLISRTLQGWGGCDVLFGAGDPTDLFVSGLPAASRTSPSRSMLVNGYDVSKMLPVSRPAAPWKDGSVIFTTDDGKMMPFQPGSSIQKAWVYLVFATMGSGKSVLLNTIEVGMCLAPGLSKLPMMTIIDIGESVSGTISLIQSSLPENRRNEAGYFRVKMSQEFAYNVFDLQLGFQFPHSRDRDFLKSFLSMLATPAGQSSAPPMMSELMGAVVDEAYRQKCKSGNPNKYQSGIDHVVDATIRRAGISVDSETTWHEIVDQLFELNLIDDSVRAQRYAVPNLQNIPNVLRSGAIRDVFGRTAQGSELIETASIMINSAIRDYPVLSMPTQWDIGSCRVVGIDLNDVKGYGEAGAKQTALMYAFAQQSAAKNYYLNTEALAICPPEYLEYHKGRVAEIFSELKAIVYDEFHNTRGIEGIRKIVSIDIREGRKWNIMTVLSSQLLSDFDEDAIENMTGTFILGANNNEGVIDKCRTTFGLTDSAVTALRRDVNSPGYGLAIFNTKDGSSTMVFRNHLSPIKMWAFTSTSEDKALRRLLYDAMPASAARKMLAERFPKSGEFKAYVEQKRNEMGQDSEDGNVIQQVANEMIAKFRSW